MILLDTEALIWVDQDDTRLGAKAKQLIANALDQSQLAVSTISFWEIAWLIKKQRIQMTPKISEWRNALLDTGIQEIPVNGLIGIPGNNQSQGEYLSTAGVAIRDVAPTLSSPRDKLISTAPHLLISLIVATAIRLQAALITSDDHLLAWAGQVNRHDARN